MLQVTELRIGNLIQLDGPIESVSAGMLNYLCQNDDPNYVGIPLTEEWLQKAGFETRCYLRIKGHFVLSLEKYSGQFWLGDTAKYKILVKHVHSLQNLYFALMGEELEFAE